jgi:uncharacterized membrane-anchored protein YhcB (DUF1043 family)
MKFTVNEERNKKTILGKFGLEDLQSKSQLNSLKEQGVLNEKFFQDLEKLQRIEQLVGTEGVNVTLANQLNDLIPGFLNEQHPLSGFTSDTSPVEKRYSLEAIETFSKNLFTSGIINDYSYWDFGLEDNKIVISIDEHDKVLHEHIETLDKVFEDFHNGHKNLLIEVEKSQQVGLEAADGVLEKIMEFFAKHMQWVIIAMITFIGALVGWLVNKLINREVDEANKMFKDIAKHKDGKETMDYLAASSKNGYKTHGNKDFSANIRDDVNKAFKGKLLEEEEAEKEKKDKEDKNTVDGEFKEVPKDSIHTKAEKVAKAAEKVGKLLNSQAAYYLLTGKNNYSIKNVIGTIESIWAALDIILHDTETVSKKLLDILKNASDKSTFSIEQGYNVCITLDKSTYTTFKLYAFPYGLKEFLTLLNEHGNKLAPIPNPKNVIQSGVHTNHILEWRSHGGNKITYPDDLFSGNDNNKERISNFTENLLKLNKELNDGKSDLKEMANKSRMIKAHLSTLTKSLSSNIKEIGDSERPTHLTKEACYPSSEKGHPYDSDKNLGTNTTYLAAYGETGYFHTMISSLGFFAGALKDVSKVLLKVKQLENDGLQLASAIDSLLTKIELETQDTSTL